MRSTERIPGTVSIRCLRSSAISFSCTSPTPPEMLTIMMGCSERLISVMMGSSISAGRSGRIRSIASRTLDRACSTSKPSSNFRVIATTPSVEVDLIVFRCSMPCSSTSALWVMRDSTSSGEAPG